MEVKRCCVWRCCSPLDGYPPCHACHVRFYDDTQVKMVSFADVNHKMSNASNQSVYMLFYRRLDVPPREPFAFGTLDGLVPLDAEAIECSNRAALQDPAECGSASFMAVTKAFLHPRIRKLQCSGGHHESSGSESSLASPASLDREVHPLQESMKRFGHQTVHASLLPVS